ncbi:MAG: hypothetical protein KatS3mg110_4014 [Pirellulaceae bacterium]|nr:MAG: hypothetical protein KatS3mg110_4014 [Pirellulaceae bacterium]
MPVPPSTSPGLACPYQLFAPRRRALSGWVTPRGLPASYLACCVAPAPRLAFGLGPVFRRGCRPDSFSFESSSYRHVRSHLLIPIGACLLRARARWLFAGRSHDFALEGVAVTFSSAPPTRRHYVGLGPALFVDSIAVPKRKTVLPPTRGGPLRIDRKKCSYSRFLKGPVTTDRVSRSPVRQGVPGLGTTPVSLLSLLSVIVDWTVEPRWTRWSHTDPCESTSRHAVGSKHRRRLSFDRPLPKSGSPDTISDGWIGQPPWSGRQIGMEPCWPNYARFLYWGSMQYRLM